MLQARCGGSAAAVAGGLRIGRLLLSAGAMKAGTSWLFKQLQLHPAIESAPIKEIHYFAHHHTRFSHLSYGSRLHNLKVYTATCEVGRSIPEIQRDLAFFKRYLDDPVDDRWFKNLFVSPRGCFRADFSNMVAILDDDGLRHVRAIARRVRILYLLRDPLERLWSHAKFHAAGEGDSGVVSHLTAADFTALFATHEYDRHSAYAANIARLRRHFSEREVKVLFYEDMIADPRRSLADVCAFIGIAPLAENRERLDGVYNAGPRVAMPAAFVEAARGLLEPEFDALVRLGIPIHPAWSRPASW